MTKLAIWGDSTCVSGFVFIYCDSDETNCENRTVGVYYGVQSEFLNINPYFYSYNTLLTSVTGYAEDIVYSLKICTESNQCIKAGTTDNRINFNLYQSYMSYVSSFWGTYRNQSVGQQRCLRDFGIDYKLQ
jgi:hypothetical protein